MKTFNIDTLKVEGQGPMQITEGPDNTEVKAYIGLDSKYTAEGLCSSLEKLPRASLTTENKRILMLLHLLRNGGNTVDLIYPKDFYKNGYAQVYERGITFKVSLSVKLNAVVLKTVNLQHDIFEEFKIDDELAHRVERVAFIRKAITEANRSFEEAIKNY